MADLATLNVSGATLFDAPGSDPKAPVLRGDLKVWVETKPASKTAAGAPGNYFSDGDFFYLCYATNQWSRTPMASDWT